jgi:hypothetical protein
MVFENITKMIVVQRKVNLGKTINLGYIFDFSFPYR